MFGAWVNEMGGKLLRSIGIERAKTNLGLRNLAYNLNSGAMNLCYIQLFKKVASETDLMSVV